MVAETIVVLVRQSSHFRVTRALRPIFVIDNYYFGGVRRYLRQVHQHPYLPKKCHCNGLIVYIRYCNQFLQRLICLDWFCLWCFSSAFWVFTCSVPTSTTPTSALCSKLSCLSSSCSPLPSIFHHSSFTFLSWSLSLSLILIHFQLVTLMWWCLAMPSTRGQLSSSSLTFPSSSTFWWIW